MTGAGAEGGSRRSLDAREQAALGRVVERAAVERSAATIEYDCRASAAGGGVVAGAGAALAPERPDLIVACEVGVGAIDWRAHLEALVERAGRGLVLVTANPHRVSAGALPHPEDALEVARLLWQLGRVRDCVFMVFPRVVERLAAPTGAVVAPDVARAPGGALVRRTAHLMAYVVDTTPRTPQARRRLRMSGAQHEPH